MRRFLIALCVLVLVGCSADSTPPSSSPADSDGSAAAASAQSPSDSAKKGFSQNPTLGECQALAERDRIVAEECVNAIPAEDLSGALLAVGVTTYEQAEHAVDLGVRHLFFGTGADFSMLNGRGDPSRSLDALQKRSGGRLVISVDEEGGEVQRLADIIGKIPSARQMAETMSPQQVTDMMREHGEKMKKLGFTMDFAPIADVVGAGDVQANAIGSRSFSADPAVVAEYARAYALGLQQAGIDAVFKHFPGHGHTTGDSHERAVTAPTRPELEANDLVPFARLSDMSHVSMMVGHMQTPGIDDASHQVWGAQTPASLNPAVYQLLREGKYSPGAREGGAAPFRGTIFTDDLTGMKAITAHHPGPDAAVAALQAGADQALTASGAVAVLDVVGAVRQAIIDGRIPRAHVYDAVKAAHL
ncbi:glycoside hydrolase family 3 N-terminal domain-containing protein [Corynebacterium anserum]|uniref:beta-N-acetylhexosaminidase n=1 Tax=Corynebacterium anserum TaxID=2684406 RepID=A0A7G7YLQ4_9CORY|nr:glycoside hydrolase family 3 N-terminal domain-containing protein [Corynebacterium anserum]QNH95424.1 glycoside hydrolase family 3 protein [Corynebacterium anserum]